MAFENEREEEVVEILDPLGRKPIAFKQCAGWFVSFSFAVDERRRLIFITLRSSALPARSTNPLTLGRIQGRSRPGIRTQDPKRAG